MLPQSWARKLNSHRSLVVPLALLSMFAGVALLIDRPRGTIIEFFALPLLVAGGALSTWVVWPHRSIVKIRPTSMASRFLRRLFLDGKLVPFFPILGIGIVLADLGYNLMLSATPALQTEDTIVLLAAAALLGYQFVPSRFARERDFVLTFFVFLNAILVVPLLLARIYYADFERSVDLYSWVALAPQTSAVLSLIGVANSVHAVSGSSAPGLTFMPRNLPIQVTVVITTACSGIYSFGIFAAAFVAFVLTECNRPSWYVWCFLTLGMAAAYAANVLRMAVIVLVGYYSASPETELQSMLLAHSYAGWIIFLGWIGLFWGILFRFLPKPITVERPEAIVYREPRCVGCGGGLTLTVPALRCSCGAYYHVACISEDRRCGQCTAALRIM